MKTMSGDKAMQDTVMRELEWDPKISSASHIGVSAEDGAIALTGYVSDYPERLAAVRAAERVYGVKAVADEIEVRLPGSSVRGDAEIDEEIAGS